MPFSKEEVDRVLIGLAEKERLRSLTNKELVIEYQKSNFLSELNLIVSEMMDRLYPDRWNTETFT